MNKDREFTDLEYLQLYLAIMKIAEKNQQLKEEVLDDEQKEILQHRTNKRS